jgi:hypothetical protein
MTQINESEARELKDLLQSLQSEMRASFAETKAENQRLQEEVRVGFAQSETKMAIMQGKVETGFTEMRGDIKLLDSKIGELEKQLKKSEDRAGAIDLRVWGLLVAVGITFANSILKFIPPVK